MMDPITLIQTALINGATNELHPTTGQPVKDAYDGLKELVQSKFVRQPQAEFILKEYETDPRLWEASLKKLLQEHRLDKDQEIITAAQRVLALLKPAQNGSERTNHSQFSGNVQGFAQGDYQQVFMNFGNEHKKQ